MYHPHSISKDEIYLRCGHLFVAVATSDRLARCIEAGMRKGEKGSLDEMVEKTRQVLKRMRPDEEDFSAAKKARALADPIRVAMLRAIGMEGELCVCELMVVANRSQPSTSHHLKILSDAGMVKGRRRGKWVYYSPSGSHALDALDYLCRQEKTKGSGRDEQGA